MFKAFSMWQIAHLCALRGLRFAKDHKQDPHLGRVFMSKFGTWGILWATIHRRLGWYKPFILKSQFYVWSMVPGLISSLICQTTSQPQLESFILLSSAVSLKLLGEKLLLKAQRRGNLLKQGLHMPLHIEHWYFGYTADLGCFYYAWVKGGRKIRSAWAFLPDHNNFTEIWVFS